jgi:hypothetical protein
MLADPMPPVCTETPLTSVECPVANYCKDHDPACPGKIKLDSDVPAAHSLLDQHTDAHTVHMRALYCTSTFHVEVIIIEGDQRSGVCIQTRPLHQGARHCAMHIVVISLIFSICFCMCLSNPLFYW